MFVVAINVNVEATTLKDRVDANILIIKLTALSTIMVDAILNIIK